jgi:protein involved in polysaccharide export with SLBB domain
VPTRLLLLSLVLGCLTAAAALPAVAQEQPAAAVPTVSVVLRPGDRVRLKVWREPDLSGDFEVDEDGIVVFPKVGRVDVQRISTDSLKAMLIVLYTQSLRNPSVEVTVLRRLNVLGSVRNPGLYYIDPTTTVADALALAGGVSPDGKQDRFELIRGGKRMPIKLSQDSRLADSPMQPGDQLWVPERSWISRNAVVVSAAVTSLAIILTATFVR